VHAGSFLMLTNPITAGTIVTKNVKKVQNENGLWKHLSIPHSSHIFSRHPQQLEQHLSMALPQPVQQSPQALQHMYIL
jgi:hypothetical protein